MAVSLGWGVLFVTDTLEMWHAAVLLTLHGLAGVLWNPAAQLFIHDIVEDEQLHSAIRLTATARWLGLLMGPAVGGVILLADGPGVGHPLQRRDLRARSSSGCGRRRTSAKGIPPDRKVRAVADVVATWRAVAGNPVIASMTILVGGASLIVGNAYQAQMPEFAHDLGHPDGGITYSALLAADAAGALVAGFVLESRGLLPPNPRTAFLAGDALVHRDRRLRRGDLVSAGAGHPLRRRLPRARRSSPWRRPWCRSTRRPECAAG